MHTPDVDLEVDVAELARDGLGLGGHDFRPEYRRLGGVTAELGHPTVLALTASAAPTVRRDIVEDQGLLRLQTDRSSSSSSASGGSSES